MKNNSIKLKEKYYSVEQHPYRIYEGVINNIIRPSDIVLDAGCGRDAPVLLKLADKCRMRIGMDVSDMNKSHQPSVHMLQSEIEHIGLKDSSIDLVISRSVLEHIKNPERAYHEIYRILKPGSYFIFLTPNLYDYASIIAELIPNRFHSKIVSVTEGRNEEDTFPTYYKSNTRRQIRKLAESAGFNINRISFFGQYPSYLMFNPILFLAGTVYDKMICHWEFLYFLRGWIFCILQKKII